MLHIYNAHSAVPRAGVIAVSFILISYFVAVLFAEGRQRQEHYLLRSEKHFLRLPGGLAVFAFHCFHQSNQFALRADAAYTASQYCILNCFDAMPMADTFYIIGAEFEGGP